MNVHYPIINKRGGGERGEGVDQSVTRIKFEYIIKYYTGACISFLPASSYICFGCMFISNEH